MELHIPLESRAIARTRLERFIAVDPSGCWNFTSSVNRRSGYGAIWWNGKPRRASRFSYAVTHGTAPEGLQVCHKCDNRRCVNPDHLFLGTASDNVRDAVKKGRQFLPLLRGESSPLAKLTQEEVKTIRQLCVEKQLTQQQIADRFNISRQQVSKIHLRIRWAE